MGAPKGYRLVTRGFIRQGDLLLYAPYSVGPKRWHRATSGVGCKVENCGGVWEAVARKVARAKREGR